MSLRKACVIGWPIAHSRSPIIHNHWLRALNIEGSYERVPVKPEDLAAFLASLGANGYAGCNITIPHKEQAFGLVDIADEPTARLGVVNTIFLRDGRLMGTSTDGEGFVASIEAAAPSWSAKGKKALFLGAGGAARAIAGTLMSQGIGEIVLANRSPGNAERIREAFGRTVVATGLVDARSHLPETDLLVNTTSLGMKGQPPLEIELVGLKPGAIVSDIVYVPLETPLVKSARAMGHRAVPGLGMLLHQAVRGFELWFGTRPNVTDELQDLVARDIDPDYRRP